MNTVRLAIVQAVEIIVFSKSTPHTKKKLSTLIALLLFETQFSSDSLKSQLDNEFERIVYVSMKI